MDKIILILILLVVSVQVVSATCDDVNMDVIEVQKNESCYTFFNVIFEDPGCEYNCFSEVSNFVVKQGDEIIKNESGIFTTYFGINFHNPDCNAEDVYLIVYDTNNQVYCQKDFLLEIEFEEFQASLIPVNNTNTTNDENIEVIESLKAKESDEKDSPSSGGMAGAVPSEPEDKPIQTIQPVTTSKDTNIYVVSTKSSNNAVNTAVPATNNKEKSFDYNTLLIPGIILAVLIAGVLTFIILRSEKKVGKKKKR